MAADRPAPTTGLKVAVGIPLAILMAGFPIAMVNVFILGGDRQLWADFLAVTYLLGFYGMFIAPWLPTSGLSDRPWLERLEVTVVIWFWCVYLTAMTWELPYLLFSEAIKAAKDQMWAYSWWAWIDGGDFRYLGFDPTILTLEWFTVLNAFAGLAALRVWYRSGRTSLNAVFVFMLTAASHFYQTMQYYVSQAIVGFPSVGDTFFDLVVRFILVNSPWVVMPVMVWIWATQWIRTRVE